MSENFNATPDDEIDLLDLLLVVVENLRLLILGPLFVGLLALAVSFFLTPTYQSEAVQSGDAKLVAMYQSAKVLGDVVINLNLAEPGEGLDIARARVAKMLSVKRNKDGTIQIIGNANSPEQAHAMVKAAMDSAEKMNAPRTLEIQRTRERLELALVRENEYASAAKRISQEIANKPGANLAFFTQSQSQLLNAARDAQQIAISLGDQLRQVEENFEVIQQPTLPTQKIKPRKSLIAVFSALAAGFVLLLFVFIRNALMNATRNVETAEKVMLINERLKKAIGIYKS